MESFIRGSHPEDFFQSDEMIEKMRRKEQQMGNTLGSPIKMPSKILSMAVFRTKNDETCQDSEFHELNGYHIYVGCSDGYIRCANLMVIEYYILILNLLNSFS
jgi:hypothetical protein